MPPLLLFGFTLFYHNRVLASKKPFASFFPQVLSFIKWTSKIINERLSRGGLYLNQWFEQTADENTSGRGSGAYVPSELKRWNWGAFFLTWIWGLGNRVYLSLFWFVPIIGWFLVPFLLGAKGNAWAWEHKRWENVQHFQKVQHYWALAGIVFFLFLIISISVLIIIGIFWLGPIIIDFFTNNEWTRFLLDLLSLFGIDSPYYMTDPTSL